MHFTTYSSSADSMDPASLGSNPLYMLFQSALAMHSFIKSVVASQNIFLGSPGVSLLPKAMHPGYEATQEFLRACMYFSISATL